MSEPKYKIKLVYGSSFYRGDSFTSDEAINVCMRSGDFTMVGPATAKKYYPLEYSNFIARKKAEGVDTTKYDNLPSS